MKKDEYEKMYLLEETHFWFVGKRYFIQTYLNKVNSEIKNILDVGSGTGSTTKFLARYGQVTGVEKNRKAISLAKKRGLKILRGEAENLPVKNNTFDLITIFDVLYHRDVKSVNKAIVEIKRALKIGGYLLMTDSAFSFLRGQHSKELFEVRRFTIKKLEEIFTKHSFKIIASSYIFFSLLPLIFLKRKFFDGVLKSKGSDVFALSNTLNVFFITLLRLESYLLKYIKFPIGSSLIILAKKYK